VQRLEHCASIHYDCFYSFFPEVEGEENERTFHVMLNMFLRKHSRYIVELKGRGPDLKPFLYSATYTDIFV